MGISVLGADVCKQQQQTATGIQQKATANITHYSQTV